MLVTRMFDRLFLAALLACATLSLAACDTALRRSERAFVFPYAMMNAEFGPRAVERTDWDPFGWAGHPDDDTVDPQRDTAYARAEPTPAAQTRPQPPARPVADTARPAVAASASQSAPATAASTAQPQTEPVVTAQPAQDPSPRVPTTKPVEPAAPVADTAPPSARTAAARPSAVREGSGPADLTSAPAAEAYDPADAAAYVAAVYAVNSVDLGKAARGDERTPTIVELYRHAYRKGIVYQSERPATGDLVFFHNTFDRNGDGRWNDWYTLVGVVETVAADGTVSALAYVDGQVTRVRLNLDHAEVAAGDDGRTLNSQLRDASQVPATGATHAAALFAGYANLLGDIPRVTVIDNWQPGMLTARR